MGKILAFPERASDARSLRAPEIHDAIVVGAGPAGSGIAARLAERGLSVLLCERADFPRDKLCGEFLSPDALSSLERLGVAERIRLIEPAIIRRFRLTAPRGRPVERGLEHSALGLSRRQLDTLLATAAWSSGVMLREGCRITAVRRAGPQGSGRTELFEVDALAAGASSRIRARAVIDAAGRNGGLVDRARPPDIRELVAFKRHYTPRRRAPSDAVEIHAFRGGYCGIAGVEGGLVNACFIGRASVLRAAGGRPEDMLAAAAADNAHLAARLDVLEPMGDGFLSTAGLTFVSPGPRASDVLQVGDAAGMIAPVCGDGMAMALRSAELADAALAPYFAGSRTWDAALHAYHAAWSAEFTARLRLGALVQRALLRPPLASALLAAGRLVPSSLDWVVRGTRDWKRIAG